MINMIVERLAEFGVVGVIAGYFLYNDYQDRKAFRDEIRQNKITLNDHETRISIVEERTGGRNV